MLVTWCEVMDGDTYASWRSCLYLGSFSTVTISSLGSCSSFSSDGPEEQCAVFPISRSSTSTSGSFVLSTLATLFFSCWSSSLEDKQPSLLRRLLRTRPRATGVWRPSWITWRSSETFDPSAKSVSSIVFLKECRTLSKTSFENQ